ncbi:MAG: TonB-dependent siderophore receptor [Acidovorax sp.]
MDSLFSRNGSCLLASAARVTAGVAISAVGAVPAWSAEETSLPDVTISADQEAKGSTADGYREDRVSNVGPWQGRTLHDTPYSLTVFSEELIENLQAVSADQVYRVNPTMQLSRSQYENNQPTVNVRGFNFYSSYRDGIPDDQYGHATTMEDTERVEVLNGLSGFLYGSGNVGGLVNYVTKRSTDERLNSLTVSSRGNKSWYVHGDFGGKFDADGQFGYRLNLAKQGGDTPIKGQEIDRTLYSLVLDAKPRSDLYLQVSAARLEYDVNGAQAAWAGAAGTRPSADALRTDRIYGPSWTQRHYETNRYTAHAKWDVSQSFGLRATLLASDGRRNSASSPVTNTFTRNGTYTQSISNVYAPGVDDSLSFQDDLRGALYADFKFDTGRVNHKVTAGYQYSNTKQDWYTISAPRINGGTFPIGDPGNYIDRPNVASMSRGERTPRFRNKRENFMVGDDITFNDHWSMLAGVGRTTISSLDYRDSALTPTLSLIFKPVPELTTYVSYMESLESGGTAADEYNGVPVVNKGQVFQPLKSKQLEIGAKYSWNGMLFSGALFQIDKGLQYYDLSNPSRPLYVQDGRQVHKGVEFTAIGKITRDVSLLGGFTWLDPKVTKQKQNPLLEGKRPTVVSDKLFKLRVEYAVPQLPGLSLSAGLNATSSSYADTMNTDRLPGYTVYDLGLRYQWGPAKNPTTLRLDIYNAGDKHFWANASALGEPRTVALSLNHKF